MSSSAITQSISEKLYFIYLPKISLHKILILGAVLSISLLAFYIFQISRITGAVSSVSEYERKISILSQQNKDLEMGLLRKNTASNLEVAIRKLNFEKVDRVNYIQIMDNEMAIRR